MSVCRPGSTLTSDVQQEMIINILGRLTLGFNNLMKFFFF